MNEHLAEIRYNFLEKYFPFGFFGAEIGVFKGHFSKMLLRKRPSKLYLVDPWYRLGPQWSWVKGEDQSTIKAYLDIFAEFDECIHSGSVVPLPLFSREFLKLAPAGSLDFVYIDSSHSYEGTVAELALARAVLKPTGVLLGDDWRDDSSHPHYGVAKAVLELIDSGGAEPLFQPQHRQWGLRYLS